MIVLLVYKHKMFMSLLFVMLYYMTSSFPISSFASQLEYCTLKYAFGFFFSFMFSSFTALYPLEGISDGQIISGICSSSVQRETRTAGW